MTPEEITTLIDGALDTFSPITEKPSDDELTNIRETLSPLLLDIPYDEAQKDHNLVGLIMRPAAYAAKYLTPFAISGRLPVNDDSILDNATTGARAKSEKIHNAKLVDRKIFEAAERSTVRFLRGVI